MELLICFFVVFAVLGILKNSPSVKTDPEYKHREEALAFEDNEYLN